MDQVERVVPPHRSVEEAHIKADDYAALYQRSIDDPDGFWRDQARRIDWFKEPTRIANWSFDPVDIKWYEDGILNLCFNCVDRHLPKRSGAVALIWEGDEPGVTRSLTYGQLHA